jgi:hypothetical protein
MNKSTIAKQIRNRLPGENQGFATASQLRAVVGGYGSARYFKEQWLAPLEVLPPGLYSIDDFAEAWVSGIIPTHKERRGRKVKEAEEVLS